MEPTISKKVLKDFFVGHMGKRIDFIFDSLTNKDYLKIRLFRDNVEIEFVSDICVKIDDFLESRGLITRPCGDFVLTGKSLPEKIEITDEMCEEGSVWINDERGKEEYTLYYSIGGDMWYFENKEWGWSSVQFDTAEGICRYQIEHGFTFLRPADKLPKAAFDNGTIWELDCKEMDVCDALRVLCRADVKGAYEIKYLDGTISNRLASKLDVLKGYTYREDLELRIVKKENNNE